MTKSEVRRIRKNIDEAKRKAKLHADAMQRAISVFLREHHMKKSVEFMNIAEQYERQLRNES